MRLLVIGGTVFVGRAVVREALDRGHSVTIFHRGEHGADLFEGEVSRIRGDRRQGMRELRGRSFDAVIDTCLFSPNHAAPVETGHYVFVSTAGVYRDWPAREVNELSAVRTDGDDYSSLKAACERRLEELYPGRVLHARSGVVVGPHENVGRLPWWLRRMQRGGEVLVPGSPQAPIQLIDVRDLAAFLVMAAERRLAGPYNLVAPPGYAAWGEMIALARRAANPEAKIVWVDRAWIRDRLHDPWDQLPLWPDPALPGLFMIDPSRAISDGLSLRGLGDTVADTWAWLADGGRLDSWRKEVRPSGLDPALEERLLADLRAAREEWEAQARALSAAEELALAEELAAAEQAALARDDDPLVDDPRGI